LAVTDGATFLEIKEGPYDPATASQFAPWRHRKGMSPFPHFSSGFERCTGSAAFPLGSAQIQGCPVRLAEERAQWGCSGSFHVVYRGRLQQAGWQAFNIDCCRSAGKLRLDDAGGRAGPRRIIPALHLLQFGQRMHQVSPTFAELERGCADMCARLQLYCNSTSPSASLHDDCWVNIMPRQVVHGLHLHPLSTLSGTYYVKTPKGCAGLKFEDPRLDRFMAAPPGSRIPHRQPAW